MSNSVDHGVARGAPQPSAGNRPDEAIFSFGLDDAPASQVLRPVTQHAANRPAARPAREAWRQQLIVDNYGLVQAVARQVHARLPRHVEVDDLMSAGAMGLIDAAERFEVSREVPFRAFARTRIRGAMVDSLRSDDWVPAGVRRRSEAIRRTREQLGATLGHAPSQDQVASSMAMSPDRFARMEAGARVLTLMSTETPLGEDGDRTLGSTLASDGDVLEVLASTQQSDAMTAALARLPDREREAVVLYYLEGQTLEEVGETLGVTLSRAYQLRTRGVERIRYCMQRHLD
jgi:RNA polymerase sigma factor for flagellar operon FliA